MEALLDFATSYWPHQMWVHVVTCHDQKTKYTASLFKWGNCVLPTKGVKIQREKRDLSSLVSLSLSHSCYSSLFCFREEKKLLRDSMEYERIHKVQVKFATFLYKEKTKGPSFCL